jgi:hypothetical protein
LRNADADVAKPGLVHVSGAPHVACIEHDRRQRDAAALILVDVEEIAACSEIEGEDDCEGCRARRWNNQFRPLAPLRDGKGTP